MKIFSRFTCIFLLIFTSVGWYLNTFSFSQEVEGHSVLDFGEARSGGDTTVFNRSSAAFSFASSNMNIMRKSDFFIGNNFFEDPWVTAPATTDVRDGLGPLFNVSSCQSCHVKDGRASGPLLSNGNMNGVLIRLSREARTEDEEYLLSSKVVASIVDENYGGQIQDRAIAGVLREAELELDYKFSSVTFDDGHVVELRKPVWRMVDKAYGELDKDITLSVRVAPPVIGLGLLEAIAADDILAYEDVDDSDNNGISGRANYVKDIASNDIAIGRFGWKAGQPSVEQQSAAAFLGDMGLSSKFFTEQNCAEAQRTCLQMENGNGIHGVEVTDEVLALVSFYLRNLAVPARRDVENTDVIAGEKLFHKLGCSDCHRQKYITPKMGAQRVEQSEQTIFPYTDMLLHDMGRELADFKEDGSAGNLNEFVEFDAMASEWRTPPLWGIGLTQIVNPKATYLHDGRARTLMEAILWHGGEAKRAQSKVLTLDEQGRSELIHFLESL